MLDEFTSTIESLRETSGRAGGVAANTAVDTLELAFIPDSPDTLAGKTFRSRDGLVPARVVAQREGYDFTKAQQRLSEVYGLDRTAYYARAVQEYATDIDRLQFYEAVVNGYYRAGA